MCFSIYIPFISVRHSCVLHTFVSISVVLIFPISRPSSSLSLAVHTLLGEKQNRQTNEQTNHNQKGKKIINLLKNFVILQNIRAAENRNSFVFCFFFSLFRFSCLHRWCVAFLRRICGLISVSSDRHACEP